MERKENLPALWTAQILEIPSKHLRKVLYYHYAIIFFSCLGGVWHKKSHNFIDEKLRPKVMNDSVVEPKESLFCIISYLFPSYSIIGYLNLCVCIGFTLSSLIKE